MFTHILVPLDGSELAECVFPHVRLQAALMGAEVTLLHSLERDGGAGSPSPVHPVEWRMRRAQAKSYLEKAAKKLRSSLSSVNVVLLEGPAAESIIDYAHGNHVDYMILSTL